MQRFGLDDIQAQAILDMRLKALQGLDREKLQNEYQELEDRIAYYERVLGDMGLVKSILKDELTAIRDKYGDERRTEIQDVEDEIDIEDLIEEEDCCYTLSNAGYIKRLPVDTYRTQRRGARRLRPEPEGGGLRQEPLHRLDARLCSVLHEHGPRPPQEGLPHPGGRAHGARHEHRQYPAARAGRARDGHAADARIHGP